MLKLRIIVVVVFKCLELRMWWWGLFSHIVLDKIIIIIYFYFSFVCAIIFCSCAEEPPVVIESEDLKYADKEYKGGGLELPESILPSSERISKEIQSGGKVKGECFL